MLKSLNLMTLPSGGEIFVEKCTVYRITPGRGEIFFYKSTLGKEIVRSLRSESLSGTFPILND